MRKEIVFVIIFRSRAIIAFDLIIVKKKTNAEHPSAHASIISFYKNVNTYFHAIFFFSTFLLFIIRKKKEIKIKIIVIIIITKITKKIIIMIKTNEANKAKVETKTKTKKDVNSKIRISIIIFIIKKPFAKRASIRE